MPRRASKTEAEVWDSLDKPDPTCRKQRKMWTQTSGARIRICDMSNFHLVNATKMVKRVAEIQHGQALVSAYSLEMTLVGEQAQYEIENDIRRLEREGSDIMLPEIYWNLVEEVNRRGLQHLCLNDARTDRKPSRK